MSGPPPPQHVPADAEEARRYAADVRGRLEATIARASSFTERLGVIFDELTFHNQFVNRDLDKIERVLR